MSLRRARVGESKRDRVSELAAGEGQVIASTNELGVRRQPAVGVRPLSSKAAGRRSRRGRDEVIWICKSPDECD